MADDLPTDDPPDEEPASIDDGSLESFERRYQASKGGSLSELEDRYQRHKVMQSGVRVGARITDAGVDGRIYLTLTVAGTSSFLLSFERTVTDMVALYDCYRLLGVEYGHDLTPLIGQDVTVAFESESLDELTLGDGPLSVTWPVEDAPAHLPEATEFPERIADAIARRAHYEALPDSVVRAPVTSAWADGDTLAIQVDLLGTVARIDVPVPPTHEMADTDFERVVETLGHGSVRQIPDGTLYAVRAERLDDSIGAVNRAIGTVDDWATTWALYAVEANAEMLVDVSSLAAADVVPERSSGETASMDPDDRTSGSNGETGRSTSDGGSGESDDSETADPDAGAGGPPGDRDADSTGNADRTRTDGPGPMTTIEARGRYRERPDHRVSPGLVEPFVGALDRHEVVHYVAKGGPIEIRTGGDVDRMASFTGHERIAVTDRRVLLKSSSVLGAELHTVPYAEIDGASLRSGLLEDHIVVSVPDGEYRISVVRPDTGACRDLVAFVDEHAEA